MAEPRRHSCVARRNGRVLPALLAAFACCRFLPAPGAFAPAPRQRGAPAAPPRQPEVARRFFDGLFGEKEEEKAPALPDVVIKEDYTLSAVFGALGVLLCAVLPYAGLGIGGLCVLLAILFFVQTGRVRFVFDRDCFELRTLGQGADLEQPGENIVVGGKNRWAYSSFVNYEFFPKGLVEKGLPPILVYFKETQTPKGEWDVGPGAAANSEDALAQGAVPGMVHFFPAICDAQQIKAEFERRGCKKIPS